MAGLADGQTWPFGTDGQIDILEDLALVAAPLASVAQAAADVADVDDMLTDFLGDRHHGSCALEKHRIVGWGHWSHLTPAQRALRGKALAAGRANARAKRLSSAIADSVKESLDVMAAKCKLRARFVKRSQAARACAKGATGASKVLVGCLKFFNHKGRSLTLSPAQMLSIAAEADASTSCKLHQVAWATNQRVRGAVAYVTLRSQANMLTETIALLSARPPQW